MPLLEATEVGYGLAGRPPLDQDGEGACVGHQCLGMGEQPCPVSADQVAQQHLGIQARRGRARVAQPAGCGGGGLADRHVGAAVVPEIIEPALLVGFQERVHESIQVALQQPGRLWTERPMR